MTAPKYGHSRWGQGGERRYCGEKQRTLPLLLLVLVVSWRCVPIYGMEWDCASTNGTFERSTDCTMSDEVAVSGDLTVLGRATVYSALTAASGKRHFKITSGALRLKWLNMTGGDVSSAYGTGGSIYVEAAHLNISHCIFFNNLARSGGAIGGSLAARLNISRSVFFRNHAGRGGAVYASSSALVFTNVTFENNSAIEGGADTGEGGAMHIRLGTFKSESNTFQKNTAALDGGAMYIYDASAISITGSSFRKNTAGWHGGGIYVFVWSSDPSHLDLTRIHLIENKQTGGGTDGYKGGGGLY